MPARLSLLILASAVLSSAPAAAEVSFAREVAPVIQQKCVACHGERVGLGAYRANTFAALMRAGASGVPSVVARSPEKSKLYQLVVEKSPAKRMPRGDDPLTPAQIDTIRRWIAEGAKFDGGNPNLPLSALLGPREHPLAPKAYKAPLPIFAVALAPGGKAVLAGGYHEVTVWSVPEGRLVRRLQRLPQRIQALRFSPDGKSLLVAGGTPGEYGEVALVDPVRGRRTRVLDTWSDIVLAAEFSADGRRVAAGGADAGVRVYDTATGKQVWNSRVHSDWVTGVSFSPDGKFLASSSKDMTVKVYDAATGALFTTYNGHNKQYGKYRGHFPVWGVQFAGERTAVSAGAGPTIQIWDPVKAAEENGTAADMEERFAKESHAQHIEHGFRKYLYAVLFRGGRLFAASADGVLKQFDLAARKEVRAYRGHTEWIFAVDYDPRQGRAVTSDYSGEVRVWDANSGECVGRFRALPGLPAGP